MSSNILLGSGISLGGAAGSSGKLLCSATDSSGTTVLQHFVEVVFTFDTVVQASPIYDTGTWEFTIPSSGMFALQLTAAASVPDYLSGYIAAYKNGTPCGTFPEFTLRAGDIVANGVILFEATAGDVVKVASMVNAPTSGGGALHGYSNMRLFSL